MTFLTAGLFGAGTVLFCVLAFCLGRFAGRQFAGGKNSINHNPEKSAASPPVCDMQESGDPAAAETERELALRLRRERLEYENFLRYDGTEQDIV